MAALGAALWQDLRYGIRYLAKSPGFTSIAVIIMGLGIGVNTAIFSFINAMLFHSLPYKDPHEVIRVYTQIPESPRPSWISYPEFRDFVERSDVFATAAIASDGKLLNIIREEGPEAATGEYFSAEFFSLLDFSPTIGRTFIPEENEAGTDPVVIISHALWQRRYGGDPGILGQTIPINGYPVSVIGVGPRGFKGTLKIFATDYWLSMGTAAAIDPFNLENRANRSFRMFGRLRSGVALQQAEARLDTLSANLAMEYPETYKDRRAILYRATDVWLDPLVDAALIPISAILLAVVGLVLLVACSNLAGMLLMRASSRLKEVAVRLALGAGRGRIVRQFLTESALLGVMGGALGLLIALWIASAFTTVRIPLPIDLQMDLRMDWRVLLYTLLISIATGIVFGLAPALRASRRDIVGTIKDENPSLVKEHKIFTLRNVLVVTQVAVSVVLLVGGGLFLRSMGRGGSIDPGFESERAAIISVDVSIGGYEEEVAGRAVYDRYLQRVAGLPGVQSAALASHIPFSFFGSNQYPIRLPEVTVQSNDELDEVHYATVSANFFDTMSIPILQGRAFSPQDAGNSPRVAIINETMAKHYWESTNAVGRTFMLGRIGQEEAIEVVGVAQNTYPELDDLRGESEPYFYLPFLQSYNESAIVIVGTTGNPTVMPDLLRRELRELDPRIPVFKAATMAEHLQSSVIIQKVTAGFLSAFGFLTMILASIGLYGLVAFSVSQRTREVGIRVALGAQTKQVVRMVLRQGVWLIVAGLVVGLPIAGLAMLPLSGHLLGVSTLDPVTFVGVSVLLLTVAIVASYVPARRAAAQDPMTALRYE
jgi:putative ABC transport system permease protein